MNNGIDEVTMARISKEREVAQSRYQSAPGLFLNTWKKGVTMAGERLFTNHQDYPALVSIDAATDKQQLIPNHEAVNEYLEVASTGEALFVAVMYSFYSSVEGDVMCRDQGYQGLGDIACGLDYEQHQIIIDLMRYHTGW